MFISAQTQALLLLTTAFGGEGSDMPLDASSFDRLAGWLRKRSLQPADLLQPDAAAQLGGRGPAPMPTERIMALLARGPALAAALGRWQQAGLWVLGRGDPDYPRRLKRRLRTEAPALLFGSGDRTLLNRGGIALIGGDAAAPETVGFAARFATQAAGAGLAAISGGGNAIEEAALLGGLARGGDAIAVLPGGLLQAAVNGRLQQPAGDGQLVLVSEIAPDLPPAASPVRCLFGLSDAALLVAVGRDAVRWTDALEAIERGWVPLWVRPADPDAARLTRLGAHALPGEEVAPRTLLSPVLPPLRRPDRARLEPEPTGPASNMAFVTPPPAPSLVGFAEAPAPFGADEPAPAQAADGTPSPAGRRTYLRLVASGARTAPAPSREPRAPGPSLFEIFVRRLPDLLADEPLSLWRIADALELIEQQAETWLRRAEADGQVRHDPVTRLYTSGPER